MKEHSFGNEQVGDARWFGDERGRFGESNDATILSGTFLYFVYCFSPFLNRPQHCILGECMGEGHKLGDTVLPM